MAQCAYYKDTPQGRDWDGKYVYRITPTGLWVPVEGQTGYDDSLPVTDDLYLPNGSDCTMGGAGHNFALAVLLHEEWTGTNGSTISLNWK